MTTRREFIQQSAVLAAALSIAPAELFKLKKVLGIQLYTVRDEVAKNLENTLTQVAAAGYTHLELYGYDYKTRQFFGRSAPQLADLLKQRNLKAISGHYGISDFLYEPGYRWESWKHLMQDATTLGHKYVGIPYIEDKHRTPDDFKRICERLNRGGELSSAEGITTVYHNHDFEFKTMIGDLTAYEYMLKNTNPKYVKFEMDIYWVEHAKQSPVELFKKYPGRFPLWHVKDMEAPEGDKLGQTCEVGKGIINWKEI
ncbi:MAG: sugar phosphate isomerase/epimerase, partial [Bacteroidetes bacterium]|nr:sugar phosphate isomerase/epimerase [Bacteroidota bacterium]